MPTRIEELITKYEMDKSLTKDDWFELITKLALAGISIEDFKGIYNGAMKAYPSYFTSI